jgi:hypothetical protein
MSRSKWMCLIVLLCLSPTVVMAQAQMVNDLPTSCSANTEVYLFASSVGQLPGLYHCNNFSTWVFTPPISIFDMAGRVALIANGTAALGTGVINSGACSAAVTVSATGVATTDVIAVGFNGDPTAVTGYIPSTSGMLTIIPYPTANNVNFKVCNNTGSSVTPGAITLNWRVAR